MSPKYLFFERKQGKHFNKISILFKIISFCDFLHENFGQQFIIDPEEWLDHFVI